MNWQQIGGSDYANGHIHHVLLKKYYQSAEEDLTMTLDIVGLPPNAQYCEGGEGALSHESIQALELIEFVACCQNCELININYKSLKTRDKNLKCCVFSHSLVNKV